MKALLLSTLIFCFAQAHAQVGIGTNTPDASAQLDITSSGKGILVPRMTSAQRAGISSPATGLLVYQTDGNAGFFVYKGSAWYPILDSASGGYLPLTGGTLTGSLTGTTSNFPISTTTPSLIGGITTTSSLTYKTTTGAGTTGADHIFQVGNNGATEAMRILNSGNVGIGTNAPGVKMHIALSTSGSNSIGNLTDANTALRLEETLASNAVGLNFRALNSTSQQKSFVMGINPTYNSDSGFFSMSRAGNTDIAVNMVSGNVGIGTPSPTSKLQVNGAVSTPIVYVNNTTTPSHAITLDATYSTVIFNDASNAYTLTLPSASGITGRIYRLVNQTSTTITVSQIWIGTSSTTTSIPANSAWTIQADPNSAWVRVE